MQQPLATLSPICCLALLCGGIAANGENIAMTSSNPSNAPMARSAQPTAPASGEMLVYVGTYTGAKSKGIYLFRMDTATGKLTPAGVVGEVASPSFLAIHPGRKYLYAVNEVGDFDGQKSGAVSAFAIAPGTGALTLLNQQPTGGDGPCHLAIDRTGKNVLVANYGGGSVALLPIQADGRLGKATSFLQHQGSGVNPQRQDGPHAHSARFDANNRFAFVTDLGLDQIFVYRFDPKRGTLTPGDPPTVSVAPGSGPRHLVFHPNGRLVYVINELNSTVTTFAYDARTGTLQALQALSTLPEGFIGNNTTAEVQVSPNGRFLYGSNRGHDSIVIFSIDPHTGLLNYIGNQSTGGKTPRNFSIDPTGTYLLAANQDSDSLVVFRIDPETGKLTPTGQVVEAPTPVCIAFLEKQG